MNPWIQHCKKYATDNNCSYTDALKRAKATYKKHSGAGNVFGTKKIATEAYRPSPKKMVAPMEYMTDDKLNEIQRQSAVTKTKKKKK